MNEVVNTVEELTPAWVTDVLHRNGALAHGQVANVSLKSRRELFVSVVMQLEITYTPDADESAPHRLFFKLPNERSQAEKTLQEPPEEIVFYRHVAGEMPDPPLPRCFSAGFDRASGRWHLLLEDLSASHAPASQLPSFGECALAIDSLAQIHAHWWEHPRLGTEVGRFLSAAEIESLAQDAASNHKRFADALGDRLSTRHRRIYAQVLATFPRPWMRLSAAKGLTLTHGDAHVWNFLYPRVPGGRAILVDWQLWHAHIGPRDLAYMMTLFWDSERRAAMEEKLLRRYYQGLVARGVKGYAWEDCWKDYRWSAIRNIFVPTWPWLKGLDTEVSWSRTLNALRAFEDLHCSELIES
jgi:hypothetical protein